MRSCVFQSSQVFRCEVYEKPEFTHSNIILDTAGFCKRNLRNTHIIWINREICGKISGNPQSSIRILPPCPAGRGSGAVPGFTMCLHGKKRGTDRPPLKKRAPRKPCRPVITCTFTARWVASSVLYHFQLPAADSSREACEPRADLASRITKCGLKKDLSQTPQGTYSPYHIRARDARETV